MRKKTEQEKQAEAFFRVTVSQLDDILDEVKQCYDNEDEPTLDRIHLDLHNLFLKIRREKGEGMTDRDLAGRKIVNLVREGREGRVKTTGFFTTYCEERMMQRKRLKSDSTLKMTGEDIIEKVFDECSSLEELNKELEKIDEQEEVMVKGWSTDDRAFNAKLARGLEKLACMLRRAMK